VSERLPVLSGQQLIDALEKVGWVAVRQRGSHVRLKHDERTIPLVVPLHRELKRGTLAGDPPRCRDRQRRSPAASLKGTTPGILVSSVTAVDIPSARCRTLAGANEMRMLS
jgi:predicted RNA binding protein YcfA (HicA-like mRNA interferase family)